MKHSIKNLLTIILIMLSLIVSAVGVTPAAAALPVTVDSLNDPGTGGCDVAECTLREAITEAPEGSTIDFDPDILSGQTILLTNALDLTKNLTIDGSQLPSQVTISGGNTVRVFHVAPGKTVTFDSLKIVNGNSGDAQGGAMLINSGATVNVVNSTFTNNISAFNSVAAGVTGGGGAIYNAGTLTISGSTFSANIATGPGGDGGAIMSVGSIAITNSTFYNNSAATDGSGGTGGAIRLDGGVGPNTLTHLTLSNNANDTSFGVLDVNNASATLRSSILANSTSGLDCTKRNGGTLTSGNNLIESGATCSPVITLDPKLNSLQNNSGPTETMALLPLSPALGAGDPTICAAAPVSNKDQRGEARPQGDPNCDIGAFESSYELVPPSLLSFTRKTPANSPTNADTLVFLATFDEAVQPALVDESDFAVNGTTTASVTDVSTSDGGITYDITISGGDLASFNGIVGLNLANTQNIKDLSENPLPNGEPTINDLTYRVDNIAPVPTIDVAPVDPSNSPNADFGFFADDDVSSVFSFYCKLDGGAWVDCSDVPITSSGAKSYTGLSEGSHIFYLDVVDEAGNRLDPNFEEYPWTIKLPPGAPTVTAPIGVTNDNTPTISGTAQVGSSVDVFWFDSTAWQPIPACQDVLVDGSGNWSCVSNATWTDGDIDLSVFATDADGVSEPASHTFTIYCSDINISVGNEVNVCHSLPDNQVRIDDYPSVLDGPVKVVNPNGEPFFTSQQTVYGSSFNELMGYPADQFTTEYWFPWYDGVYMNSWVLIGNPSDTQTAYVDIYIGGVKKNNTPGGVPYAIPPGDRVLPQFPGVLDGPVRVVSVTGTGTSTPLPIFASERSTYLSSFNEVMGYPADQFTTEYWFPWYDQVYMNSWILVGNPSDTQTAYVDIYIGGVKRNNTLGGIPYAIPPNGRVLPQFPGVLDGAVRVVSVTGEGTSTPLPVFASERSTYQGSFNEVMGYPTDQFTTEYWYTWYDNQGMDSWVLVGNPSTTQTAYVDIYIGGVKQNDTYVIPPSGSIIPRFDLSDGPVQVLSVTGAGTPTAIPIFTSERSLYGLGFNEVMGYPADQLSSEYWFTWYDSVYMDTWILVGKP